MSTAQAVQAPSRLFSYGKWGPQLLRLVQQYRENYPCPHILLKDFLEPAVAAGMADEFPSPTTDAWTQYKHANENKLGMPKRELFPRLLGRLRMN